MAWRYKIRVVKLCQQDRISYITDEKPEWASSKRSVRESLTALDLLKVFHSNTEIWATTRLVKYNGISVIFFHYVHSSSDQNNSLKRKILKYEVVKKDKKLFLQNDLWHDLGYGSLCSRIFFSRWQHVSFREVFNQAWLKQAASPSDSEANKML